MSAVSAWLIDVFQTILRCDWSAHREVLPALAGVDAALWSAAFTEVDLALLDGRLSMAAAYEGILRQVGVDSDVNLVEALVLRDRELLVESAGLYDDTIPFLAFLRSSGIRAALISNCGENARHLLDQLGLAEFVDAVVLSCEVGCVKPSPKIYLAALDRLDAAPESTILIDDHPDYCAGAARTGITPLRICRTASTEDNRADVTSLREVETMLLARQAISLHNPHVDSTSAGPYLTGPAELLTDRADHLTHEPVIEQGRIQVDRRTRWRGRAFRENMTQRDRERRSLRRQTSKAARNRRENDPEALHSHTV
jgi:HAD superfamily hydrolase (TIGR01509 family)